MSQQTSTGVEHDEHERQIESYWAARDELARTTWRRRGMVALMVAGEALVVAVSIRAGTMPARVGVAFSVPIVSAIAVHASVQNPAVRDDLDQAYSTVLAEEYRRQSAVSANQIETRK